MHSATAAYQTRLALPPLGVEAFHHAGLTAAFLTGDMLRRGEKACIRAPVIGMDRFLAVVLGHIRPGQRQHLVRPFAQDEPEHLSHLPRDRYPQPEAGRLPDTECIHLDDILSGSRDPRQPLVLDPCFYARCVFLRTARIVGRPTLKVRAMPRWERRSWRARTICCSFSAERERLWG